MLNGKENWQEIMAKGLMSTSYKNLSRSVRASRYLRINGKGVRINHKIKKKYIPPQKKRQNIHCLIKPSPSKTKPGFLIQNC